jgi:hypothetical protein
MGNPTSTHGWTAVPRDTSILLNGKKNVRDPQPVAVYSLPLPETALAMKVLEYAQKELSKETFNHSMRVYCYGTHGSELPAVIGLHASCQKKWRILWDRLERRTW